MSDKNLITKEQLKMAIDGVKMGTVADWNENDPKAAGYVKNRPFHDSIETVLVDNLTSGTDNWPACTFIAGDKYKVTWNNVEYDCVCYEDGEFHVLGTPDDGYPFYINDDGGNGLYIEGEEPWKLSISHIDQEIKKIDQKFLPEINMDNKMDKNNPVGTGSFSMNRKEDSDTGDCSTTFGSECVASGTYSFATGVYNKALGNSSFAEGGTLLASGGYNTASGEASHAEGAGTTASGIHSHAEGNKTIASGHYSHAEGRSTKASGDDQHVQGRYNLEDNLSTFAHIVGNGTSRKRTNAHTIDWNGNAWFSGNVYVGSTGGFNRDEGSKKLLTEDDFYEPKKYISLIDEINGYRYLVCMKNGNLVSYIETASISVTAMPNKTTYADNEEFNPTGMVITATGVDGSIRELYNYTYEKVTSNNYNNFIISYTEFGKTYQASISLNIHDFSLIDFNYTANDDGTYTITSWKGTYNGEPSTRLIVPDSELIIIA